MAAKAKLTESDKKFTEVEKKLTEADAKLEGAAKALKTAGVEEPDTGAVLAGHGLRLGYYAQEHETLDNSRTILENMRSAAPDLAESEQRRILGSF